MNERGEVVYRVARVRKPDGTKDYKCLHPDGAGWWSWGRGAGRRVIYRLPEVRTAIDAGEPIYVCEGEKCAELVVALGLCATTNDGGAGKWAPAHTACMAGAQRSVILRDNDDPGRQHVDQIAGGFHGAGVPDIRLPELPGLAEGQAIDDWVARRRADGATDHQLRDELERLVEATAPWQPSAVAPTEAPAPESPFHLTQLGNAKRLVRDHGQDLRHVTAWRRWFVWHRVRWTNDTTAEVERRAKATVAGIYLEALEITDLDQRGKVFKHAFGSETEHAINAMVSLAASEAEVAVKPADLDADPWLLNVKNGTLDLRTLKLRPHDPADFITKLAPVPFDPEATHPVWDAFLEKMVPDPDERAFLQRAVGYTLTGDTSEEVLFFIHGPEAAGKGTFTGAMSALLGDYARVADFECFLRKRGDGGVRNDIARLAGARMVLSQEVDEGRALAEGLVKAITGGDVVAARFLYQESFEFKPAFKLWLVANHKPRVSAEDGAMWRRMLLVPFEVSLPVAERDPMVKETLTNDPAARAAILAWAVQGLRDWLEHGLRPPAMVRQATDTYREEQDVLAPFLADCCVLKRGAFVTNKELRDAYVRWCETNGERPLSAKTLASPLRDRGCEPGMKARVRGWWGFRLGGPDDGYDGSVGNFTRESAHRESYQNNRRQPSQASPAAAGAASGSETPTTVATATTVTAAVPPRSNGSGVEPEPVGPASAPTGAEIRDAARRLVEDRKEKP